MCAGGGGYLEIKTVLWHSGGVNEIAAQLNRTLRGTVVEGLLSEYGTRLFFPKGIVAQSAEAYAKGVRFNATQGIATDGAEPFMLPALQSVYPHRTPSEVVAYAPTGGLAVLREAWKTGLMAKNANIQAPFSEPLVTPGITGGLAIAADMFVDAGDTVIVGDPMWGNYRLILITKKQARMETYPFFSDSAGYNVSGLERALEGAVRRGDKKVVLLLNFPNNPTGYSPSVHEAHNIVTLVHSYAVRGLRIAVVLDDAYFGLWYESACYQQSLFGAFGALHENILAIKVDGGTKEEYAWGLRVGFITFGSAALDATHYGALEQKGLGALRATFSNSNQWAQRSLWRAIQSPTHHHEKERYFADLKARYSAVKGYLDATTTEALRALPFNSGYFVCLRCSGVAPEALRQKLLAEGIGIIAIGDSFIRITYSTVPVAEIPTVFDAILRNATA